MRSSRLIGRTNFRNYCSTRPVLFPPTGGSSWSSVFTDARWHVVCTQVPHNLRRPGWPPHPWAGRLSLTGLLMHRARRA